MRLIPLEIGRLDIDRAGFVGGSGRVHIPVPAWLIEHRRGLVLFDTGMHPDLQTDSGRIGSLGSLTTPDFEPGEQLAARIEAAGFAPTDVDVVVFSHLHFDHAGGTAEVPNARLMVQRVEWEVAHPPRRVAAGIYNPDDFDVGHEVELIDGPRDILGDATLTCIPTPGHTLGHQSLRVALDSGPVVLTGDCVYFAPMLDEMRVPVFGDDFDQQRASMRELQRLRDEDGCRLLFGHDPEQFASLPPDGLT